MCVEIFNGRQNLVDASTCQWPLRFEVHMQTSASTEDACADMTVIQSRYKQVIVHMQVPQHTVIVRNVSQRLVVHAAV